MSASVVDDAARQAVWMLAGQLAVVLALTAAGFAIHGGQTALSLLAGGGIGLAGSTYLVIQMLRHGGRATGPGLAGVFIAWGLKVALMLSLLTLAFRSGMFSPPALLAGLGAGLFSNWVWLSVDRTKRTNTRDGN